MTRNAGRRKGGPARKFDLWRSTASFAHTTSGAAGVLSTDVGAAFASVYGTNPYQATWSVPRFDVSSLGTGTGTGLNTLTFGWLMGPSTLDTADLDPVANPDEFWWVRKFTVQNNSNPAGILWSIQGVDSANMKVNTRRTRKALGDTLWISSRADFTGFTELDLFVNAQYGILYA